MKTSYFISLIAIAVTQAMLANIENSPALSMRDAATHEQLAATLRVTLREDPMSKLKLSNRPDPTKANQPLDFISQSDSLCFGNRVTFVPKRAILHIPANMTERLKIQPGAQLQSWSDFYAGNRGWIRTLEVSRAQAEGNLPLDKDIVERLKDSTSLVVATFLGGPISVLPPKAPVSEKARELAIQTTNQRL